MTNPVGIPKPIDQFRRPDGKPWGTPFDSSNCWSATSAEGVEFATLAKVKTTPPAFRVKSGNLKRKAGFIQDVWAGARALGLHEGTDDPYVPSFQGFVGLSWDRFVQKLEKPTLAFVVPTDYDQVPNNLSENPNFDDGHSLAVFGATLKDEGNGVKSVLVHDPINGKAKRYPLFVLKAAAEKIARAQGLPKDTIFATQFRQAIEKPPPPPPPPPPPDPETPEQAVIRLTGERDKALADLALAIAALDLAQTAQALAEAATEDAQARIDAALAALAA